MPIFLDEDQGGAARDKIGFPELAVCMAMVIQTKNWLYGFHSTLPKQHQYDTFNNYFQKAGGDIGNAVALYGLCWFEGRYRLAGKQGFKLWKKEMEALATTLGYHGTIAGYDLGDVPATAHRRYVEFSLDRLSGTVAISCCDSAQVEYQKTPTPRWQLGRSWQDYTVNMVTENVTEITKPTPDITTEAAAPTLTNINYALKCFSIK